VETHRLHGTRCRSKRQLAAVAPADPHQRIPKAPGDLRPETKRWFRRAVTGWILEEHHIRLLSLACRAWDRCEAAREQLVREGLTVESARGGPRLHPLLRVENENRAAFRRLIAQLDLSETAAPGALADLWPRAVGAK
jgi:P27 family predicted phage terminase small subunit